MRTRMSVRREIALSMERISLIPAPASPLVARWGGRRFGAALRMGIVELSTSSVVGEVVLARDIFLVVHNHLDSRRLGTSGAGGGPSDQMIDFLPVSEAETPRARHDRVGQANTKGR